MTRKFIGVINYFCVFLFIAPAGAITVTIDTGSAQAVLMALQNPELGQDEALKIAAMPGNQGMIRKMNEFHVPATNESFARALVAAAHNVEVKQPNETIFYFDTLKPRLPKLLDLLKQIKGHPETFQAWIQQRVELFSPPNANIGLRGYVVAGGDGGGYAFGEPIFFLNIGYEDEFEAAKMVTAHELYHAMQGAFVAERTVSQPKSEAAHPQVRQRQQACAHTAELFGDIYEEGSAQYVEDFSILSEVKSPLAKKMYEDRINGLRHVAASVTLLELSVLGLNAKDPVDFDSVYAVDFYGQGILYNIAYTMAKAIVDSEGPQGLAQYLKRPPYQFALDYTKLPKYGADADHPKLDSHTTAILQEAQCLHP